MAVDICNVISQNLTSTKCPTRGGTNRNSWAFQLEQFTGAQSFNATTKALSGFGLVTGEKGIKGVGRPKKGSGNSTSTTNENGSTEVDQTLIQEYGFTNQAQLDALEEFLAGGSKVVFQELANGKIRVFFKEFGAENSKGEEGTGTILNDETEVMKVTLTGKEAKFPMYFEAPITDSLTQLASSRAYLDALVQPTV
jgi:hypothetical protein